MSNITNIAELRGHYHQNRILVLMIMLCFAMFDSFAQTAFIDASAKLPNNTFYGWLQKGIADMNADGKDDIVRANRQGQFFILSQNADGTFSEKALGAIQPFTPLSVILGDIDNNGYNDILTGGQYNGVRIVKANASVYTTTRLPKDSVFTQASALADINNDGWLDAFVCNDDSTNAIWKNTGIGDFIKDPTGFDFSSVPLNKHSGNYGIVFTDFDNDGDIDAYLSKCKAGVKDSTDQRRINQLFVNEQGVYTDKAKRFGMADSSQTWVTEFQDIDNDGDMDAFIANHYTPSRLMLNDGNGYFTDITAMAGLLGKTPNGILQALMRDFDNDGYTDLLVSGMMTAHYFKNNGNLTFSEIALPILSLGTDHDLRSFAVGDLNHDGFLDIYASYFWGDPKDTDKLWLNTANMNHFLAINLSGTQSNKSGIGARITLTIKDKKYIREVRAGESYGISNSLAQHIGIGTNTMIDKVEIRWPSGIVSSLTNITADQFLNIIEPTPCQNRCVPIFVKIVLNR